MQWFFLRRLFHFIAYNDANARASQLERGGQWTKGKTCDTFNPLGAYLVTKDEIPDVHKLALSLALNGKQVHQVGTETMILIVIFGFTTASIYDTGKQVMPSTRAQRRVWVWE